MNSQLNESIEQTRNGHYYLNTQHRQSSYNIHLLNTQNEKPTNSSFIMCSSMISTTKQHQQCDTQKPKKNLKKIILSKLKKFRQRMVNGDHVSGTPTLHKVTTANGGQFSDEQSCIIDRRNVFEISEVDTFAKSTTFRRHGSDGELYESFSSSEEQHDESDMFPESNLFLFNRSDEISHLFETAVENTEASVIINQAPSSSNLIGSSVLSKNLSNIQLNQESGQTSTPILQRRALPESILYEADMTMDESTQIQVDEPVLIESTFDTSSCSNLSSDLIILQTGYFGKSATPRVNSVNQTNMSYDLVDTVPEWAMGHQLQLAVVNQIYFQQNAIFE